ncbi:hypothetical protein CgunFtcFv8_019141 [Champsocephalus gunnari]|uniref:Uncharacterized protein n=1 Tax=Champsocephalus gunnari TaxID=52237 RepID=A0AAN8HMF2_CHAGU|nr:hypothetical protein CgunFtcFv8_019141 [Champsocephalus gunnari]
MDFIFKSRVMDWILNLILLSALCSLSSCVLQPECVLFKEKKTWQSAPPHNVQLALMEENKVEISTVRTRCKC